MPRIYVRAPVIDRIIAKVVERDDCWIWTGSVGSSGYGQIRVPTAPCKGYEVLTHRFSYEYHRGEIPDGLVLDHLCEVIRCCNPWHLEPVTHAENQRRRAARRTSCSNGHPYTDDTPVTANGRECRPCHAAREAQRRERLRAKGLTGNGKPVVQDRCRQGRHDLTPENTAVYGNRVTCRDCMSESAKARRHREARLLIGSGK